MNKLRILQIITKADWAGAQRVVYELCKYIQENYRNEIELEVAVGDNGILVEKLRKMGIKVHILDRLKHDINPIVDYKGYKEIKSIITKGKYDVVHCHSTKAGILGRLAAYESKVKKILYTVHGFWPILQYHGLMRKAAVMIERVLEKRTTDMVFISKNDIRIAKQFKLYHKEKTSLIYNSITIPDVIKGTLISELHLNEEVRIIGNVSRVNEVKNPTRFIEIAKEYYQLYPKENTVFVWIGDGPLMDQVTLLVKEYGLTNQVFFIGFRDHAERYMVDFNLLLMTSIMEGIPITILEAKELKIPVLSTDVGGIREIVGEKNVFEQNQMNRDIALKLNEVPAPIRFTNRAMGEKYVKLYLADKEGLNIWK